MFDLRDYQKAPVHTGVSFFRERRTRPALEILPTAAGKSIIIGHIVRDIQDLGRTLVLQPSKELLEQNIGKLRALGGEASIYSASFKIKEHGDTITYATIGSIKDIGKEFKSLGYKHIIIDEADRYPREAGMLGKFLRESEIKQVLGLTATPFKLQTNSDMYGNSFSKLVMLTNASKKGQFFKDILHVTQIQEIVEMGYWSKLLYDVYDFDTGELVFNSTGAEFTDDSIKQAYVDQDIEKKIIKKIDELTSPSLFGESRKSILVFVPSVDFAAVLAGKVPNSAYVCAETPTKERDQIISDFRAGKIKIIFNVNVLSVGFDHPEIDTIICGRPTASLGWWYQAAGRGTRIHPNKKDCLIVDFAGNVQKFGKLEHLYYKKLNTRWRLFGEGGKILTEVPIHEIGEKTEKSETEKIELKALIKNSPDKVIVTFGKYKGKEVKDTPHHWQKWMLESFDGLDSFPDLRDELVRLKVERIKQSV